MNLVYIHNDPFPSKMAGAIFSANTCYGLAQEGIQTCFIVGRGEDLPDDECLRAVGIEPHPNLTLRRLPIFQWQRGKVRFSWNGVFYLNLLRELFRLSKKTPIDGIICRNLKVTAFLAHFKRLLRTPLFYEAHKSYYPGATDYPGADPNRGARDRRYYANERRVYPHIDGLVSLTAGCGDRIREHFDFQGPVCVARSGIQMTEPGAAAEKESDLCYVGQLHPHKGVGILVEALKFMDESRTLTVVGGNACLDELREFATQHGVVDRISFTGYVPHAEVATYLQRSRIAALPLVDCEYNRYFTSPMKLFEYMVQKIPVVATDLPGVAEILEHGRTGILVKPDDPEALAEGVETLLESPDLQHQIAESAYAEVARYSWRNRAKTIMGLVREAKAASPLLGLAARNPSRAAAEAKLPVTHFQSGDRHWLLAEDCADLVRRRVVERFDRLEEEAGAVIVKDNKVRSVIKLALEDGDAGRLYVKKYKRRPWRYRIRKLLIPSRATSEWAVLTAATRGGLPVARPLAVAWEECGPIKLGKSLVLEEIPDAFEIVPFIRRRCRYPVDPERRATRKRLFASLAQLVRRLHDFGLMHPDLHSGNILVTTDESGVPVLHLIDVHAVQFRRRIAPRRRLANIAKLFCSMIGYMTRSERLRFLHDYEGPQPVLGAPLRRAFAATERTATRQRRRRWLTRARRCLQGGSQIRIEQWPEGRLRQTSQCLPGAVQAAIEKHRELLASGGEGLLKRSRKMAVTSVAVPMAAFTSPASLAVEEYNRACVKEYFATGLRERLKRVLGLSRARRAWVADHALLVRGLPAAMPFAMLEGPQACFFVSEDLSATVPLDDHVEQAFAWPPPRSETGKRREFLVGFAAYLRGLHRVGVYHSDLKAKNVMVDPEGPPHWRYILIDVDDVRFPSRVSRRQRAKNLAQLHVSISDCISRADRLRFLTHYVRGTKLERDKKAFIQEVLAESAKRDRYWTPMRERAEPKE